MFVLPARDGHVHMLAFAPDAGTLYACHERCVHVWNLADRTSRPLVIRDQPVVWTFTLHPGGRWAFGFWRGALASHLGPHVFDLLNNEGLSFNFVTYTGGGVAPTPDGERFVTIGASGFDTERPEILRCLRLYSWRMTADGPEYEWHLDMPENVHSVFATSLGDRFATAEIVIAPRPAGEGRGARYIQIAVRRTADGAPLAALDYPHQFIHQLLATPDGTKLVARTGTEFRVWDTTNWAKPPIVVEGKHKAEMNRPAACFHPSSDYLLLANGGPSVILYDARTWKEVRKWNWKGGALRAVAVSPDGTLAAAGGPRGIVVVWDLDL